MDVSPRPETSGVSAYKRSSVDEFLASGQLEARRLEQAIAQAHVRTERATFVTERAEAISEMLHSILQDLRREFADRRLQVEAQAEGIVAAAQEDAARLLADARRDALGATAAPRPQPDRPRPDAEVPTPTYRWVAAPALTPAEPDTKPVPLTVGGANQPAEPGSDDAMGAGAHSAGVSDVAPTPVATAIPGTSGVGNGFGTASTVTDSPAIGPDETTTTIDLTADGREHRRAGRGRLRRNRRRDAAADTGDDEFLDYLRGALVDDAPLEPEPDNEPPVDWRWTS